MRRAGCAWSGRSRSRCTRTGCKRTATSAWTTCASARSLREHKKTARAWRRDAARIALGQRCALPRRATATPRSDLQKTLGKLRRLLPQPIRPTTRIRRRHLIHGRRHLLERWRRPAAALALPGEIRKAVATATLKSCPLGRRSRRFATRRTASSQRSLAEPIALEGAAPVSTGWGRYQIMISA